MTEWYAISAKFTADEKKILDTFKEVYGKNYNQTLRGSLEFLVRWMISAEISVWNDNETLNKVRKISEKYAQLMELEIKEMLKSIPIEQQEKDWNQYSGTLTNIYERFNEIFVTNRKVGRKPLKRKRGRPKDLGKTS